MDTADDLRRTIVAALAGNPHWLPSALAGIAEGMQAALTRAEHRAAIKDQATLAAFALKAGGKMDPQLRETFLARVAAAIHPENQCGYERGMIDAYRQTIVEREI